MHRNNSKRKIVIYSLLGVLLLMTVGYASFQSSLKIKGTSKVSSVWDVEITNVTSGTSTGSAENGKDENGNVVLPSWDKLSASINADLYESGDSMTYVVTIENKGTIDAEISDIIPRYSNPNQNYSSNDAIIITFSGFTKGQKLYKAGHSGSTVDITVKVSYNENYNGGAVSGEASIDFNFTQAKTENINNGDIDTENKYLITYNCIENGGTDCTGNNEYYYVGEQIDLSNNIGDVTTNGYTLIGWNTNKEAEEGLENYEMPNEDKVLYAIYSKTLNVTYQKEEGVSSISKEKDTCTMYNLNTKCEITLPTITVEDKDYYKADGWYKENEKIGSATDRIKISEDITFKAKVTSIPVMMSGPDFQTAIDSYKSSITSVEFLDDIDIPSGAISIDVSEKQNGSVMAWLVDDGNSGYKMYIGGKDGVIANEDCSHLFYNFTSATSIEFNDNFDTSNVTDMSWLFANSVSLMNLNISSFDTSKVTNMEFMFSGYSTNGVQTNMSLTKIIGLENFNTSSVTNMHAMFFNCGNIEELDLSNFDTGSVTNMFDMFNMPNDDSSKLRKIIFGSKWDTLNVTNMQNMFLECASLIELDLSSFDTSNVTNMINMFADNYNLKTIYVSEKFVTTSITSSTNMFNFDTALVGGNGTTYDSTKIDKTYALIDKEGQKGYFTLGSSNGIDLSISTSAKTESITVVSNASSNNGISKYEYSIDNGDTWIESNDTYTFNNLKENTKYNVMAKVTDSSGNTKEVSKTVIIPILTSPTYSEVDVSGSKRVRIIYPEGCESVYTCTYSKNGNDYITVTDTSEYVYFTEEGNIIAKVTDGTNEVSSSYNVIFDNLLDYTGSEETFVVSESGKYKLEVWGAQGGSIKYNDIVYRGGYGAYSIGTVELKEGDILYTNTGGNGKSDGLTSSVNILGGYNGGGAVSGNILNRFVASGGGATHIALSTGLLTAFENNQKDLLIVAGAGGGGYKHSESADSYEGIGGNGGGITGNNGEAKAKIGNYYGTGGTQNSAGCAINANSQCGGFGYGGEAGTNTPHGSAGGSGYYGGGGSAGYSGTANSSGGGGSGYIGNTLLTNKYMACYDCQTSNEYSTKTISVNCHSERPLANCAKEGNGYVKITKVPEISTPTFYQQSNNITINYPEGCNDKYTCKYSKDGENYITVTSNPTISFDGEGVIVAKVIYEKETVSSSYIVNDAIAPTLNLSKETYIEGFSNWSLASGQTVSDGILTMAKTGTSYSPYYQVNGEEWYVTYDGYTTAASTNYTPKGGIMSGTSYYDSNYTNVKSSNGYAANGNAKVLSINTWVNDLTWNGWDGFGTKYLKFNFSTGNTYSQPTTKIRNFKIWGQMPNSFYLINIDSSDNTGIIRTKYAKGNYSKDYFNGNGIIVEGNQIRVTENGTYTVYVTDNYGNATVKQISITNIN